MAKLSSFECQGLFLSLYFKDHFEITQAVVTNLRANGFWAYVPRFDFRAPVYLSDKNGDLQMDPALFNLCPWSGSDPTAGFASSGVARKFHLGKCNLVNGDHLLISVPESTTQFTLKILDVVTVSICCDDWDTKSRVPQPRIYLIADSSRKVVSSMEQSKETTKKPSSRNRESRNPPNATGNPGNGQEQTSCPTIYAAILQFETPSKLDVEFRSRDKTPTSQPLGTSIIPGRVTFGGFVNPDTRSAQQEASIQEASNAAIERRNQIMENRQRQGEFESTRKIEKDVSARMQKLAANKRNARKGKGK
jgi:hypothetical protein